MEEFLVNQIWCDPRMTFCWHPVGTCIYCSGWNRKEQRIGFWNPWDSKTLRSQLQGKSSHVEAIVLSCLGQVYIYLLFLRLVHLKGCFMAHCQDHWLGWYKWEGVLRVWKVCEYVPPGSFGQFSLTTSSLTFKTASCIKLYLESSSTPWQWFRMCTRLCFSPQRLHLPHSPKLHILSKSDALGR